jgi:hypothetical protein
MAMMTSIPADTAPPERSGTGVCRVLTSYVAPFAAVSLSIVAIVGVYVISLRSPPTGTGPRPATALRQSPYPLRDLAHTVALKGAFPPERGPDGASWQWIGDTAAISLADFKQSWLAFRAQSLGRTRTLSLDGLSGQRLAAHVGTRPEVYSIGPLSEGAFILVPTPPSSVASARDPRRVSVFLSMLRTQPSSTVAVPGAGFWATESNDGAASNWLRENGVIDVYSAAVDTASIWLTFEATSVGQPRTLLVRDGRSIERVVVPITTQRIRLGPFPVTNRRAHILVQTTPGPDRYGGDPRLLSVRVSQLTAHTSRTGM